MRSLSALLIICPDAMFAGTYQPSHNYIETKGVERHYAHESS
ncbi:hypothetical protein [Paenibacillus polymyxa]|nr:hypothetical protein [Paenibacillus polymyxa]MDN4090888.1 hypothetical protein [Paenibacillus polymyxa]